MTLPDKTKPSLGQGIIDVGPVHPPGQNEANFRPGDGPIFHRLGAIGDLVQNKANPLTAPGPILGPLVPVHHDRGIRTAGVARTVAVNFDWPGGCLFATPGKPTTENSPMTRMQRRRAGAIGLAIGFGILLALAGPAPAQDVKAAEWVSLFDGKTLGDWTIADGTTGTWKVEDGAIHGSGPGFASVQPEGRLQATSSYRAEFKIADKANSGMYFRTAKGPGFPKGYEAQVNSTHTDPVRTGSFYNFVPVKKMLVPPDTWFTQEVEAVGNHIIIKVNGETVVDFVDQKDTHKEGPLRLPATRPEKPGLDSQGRGQGTSLDSSPTSDRPVCRPAPRQKEPNRCSDRGKPWPPLPS